MAPSCVSQAAATRSHHGTHSLKELRLWTIPWGGERCSRPAPAPPHPSDHGPQGLEGNTGEQGWASAATDVLARGWAVEGHARAGGNLETSPEGRGGTLPLPRQQGPCLVCSTPGCFLYWIPGPAWPLLWLLFHARHLGLVARKRWLPGWLCVCPPPAGMGRAPVLP